MATVTKSVRLPVEMVQDIERFQGPGNFNKVVRRALKRWLKVRKRREEDAMIVRALAGRSPEQVAEEEEMVRQASASSLRVLKESGL